MLFVVVLTWSIPSISRISLRFDPSVWIIHSSSRRIITLPIPFIPLICKSRTLSANRRSSRISNFESDLSDLEEGTIILSPLMSAFLKAFSIAALISSLSNLFSSIFLESKTASTSIVP